MSDRRVFMQEAGEIVGLHPNNLYIYINLGVVAKPVKKGCRNTLTVKQCKDAIKAIKEYKLNKRNKKVKGVFYEPSNAMRLIDSVFRPR